MAWLENTRIISIYSVIFLHVSAEVLHHSPFGLETWWIANVYDSAVRWCVPVFVMMSGALLLDPNKNETITAFYEKRLSKILIPILFWTAFYILHKVIKSSLTGKDLMIKDLFLSIYIGIPHYHMWFLYMILGLYLFTPFYRKLVVSSTRNEIKLLTLFMFLLAISNFIESSVTVNQSKEYHSFINMFFPYIPYFFIGHLINTDKIGFKKITIIVFCLFSLFSTALGYYLFNGHYFQNNLSLTIVLMSISVFYLCKLLSKPIFGRKNKLIAQLTLGVYLIHPIFMHSLINFGFDPLKYNPIISIPTVALIIYATSLIGAYLILKTPYLNRTI